jgi:hypothetical protein
LFPESVLWQLGETAILSERKNQVMVFGQKTHVSSRALVRRQQDNPNRPMAWLQPMHSTIQEILSAEQKRCSGCSRQRIAVAVNVLLIEPMHKIVSGLAGT